jgi:hypothetical protein
MLAFKACQGDVVFPLALSMKGCLSRTCAVGRCAAFTVRLADTKSTNIAEAFDGSARPVGGLLLMTNIARVGGMW